eukprot:5745808-Prymnesium_polylepis.1
MSSPTARRRALLTCLRWRSDPGGSSRGPPRSSTTARYGFTHPPRDGHLMIMDRSLSPDTHWDRSYLDEVLRDSPDLGLRDTVLTHGV